MPPETPREIELKLDLDAADVALLKTQVLPTLGTSRESQSLTSVYYDTDALDLHKAGITVRVRAKKGADTFVQTVKRSDGANAGFFDRGEWESPITGPGVDAEALADTPAATIIASDPTLKPVFETVVERTIWIVSTEGSEIEVALDESKIMAGQKTHAFTELELELKRGRPADLFRLVRKIDSVRSLRTGVLTKSERGYALIGRKKPKAHKAEPISLGPDTPAADAFRAIVHACLRQFRLNETLLPEAKGPEPLHQARVGLRRLRSALSLFADLITDDRLPDLKLRLQAASRKLGEARNLDVYLEESARPEASNEAAEPGVAAFLATVQARRDAAYAEALATLAGQDFRRLVFDLVEWVETGPWLETGDPMRRSLRAQPIRVLAAEILDKRRRRVKKKGRHLAALDPHSRHRVRIAGKKLRYACEFFASLATDDTSREHQAAFLAALEQFQDHMGELNDIQTGHEIALSFAQSDDGTGGHGEFAAAHLAGRQDGRIPDLLAAAETDHAAFAEVKPFWRAWTKG